MKLVINRRETGTEKYTIRGFIGRASDYRAGGRGFEPQTGPTRRVLK